MSMFKVDLAVGHPDGGDLAPVALPVDERAAHSVLPASLLARLGIVPRRRVEFSYFGDDDAAVEYGYGLARFRIDGEEWPCPVVFGPEDDYRLGASALEIFNLEIDHAGAKLRPAKRRFLGRKAREPDPDEPQGGAAILQMFKELRESVPESTFDDWPTDLSGNFKHYLYGWPKEKD